MLCAVSCKMKTVYVTGEAVGGEIMSVDSQENY